MASISSDNDGVCRAKVHSLAWPRGLEKYAQVILDQPNSENIFLSLDALQRVSPHGAPHID